MELLSQAARDLEPWKSGITLEMVERLYCVPEAIDTFRIQVHSPQPVIHQDVNRLSENKWPELSARTSLALEIIVTS